MEERKTIENMMDIIIHRYGFENRITIKFCTIAENGNFLTTYKLFLRLTK